MLKPKLTADSPLWSCLYHLTGACNGVTTDLLERERWVGFSFVGSVQPHCSSAGNQQLYSTFVLCFNEMQEFLEQNLLYSYVDFLVVSSNRHVPSTAITKIPFLFLYMSLIGLNAKKQRGTSTHLLICSSAKNENQDRRGENYLNLFFNTLFIFVLYFDSSRAAEEQIVSCIRAYYAQYSIYR
jgi:hypothetical protein